MKYLVNIGDELQEQIDKAAESIIGNGEKPSKLDITMTIAALGIKRLLTYNDESHYGNPVDLKAIEKNLSVSLVPQGSKT